MIATLVSVVVVGTGGSADPDGVKGIDVVGVVTGDCGIVTKGSVCLSCVMPKMGCERDRNTRVTSSFGCPSFGPSRRVRCDVLCTAFPRLGVSVPISFVLIFG